MKRTGKTFSLILLLLFATTLLPADALAKGGGGFSSSSSGSRSYSSPSPSPSKGTGSSNWGGASTPSRQPSPPPASHYKSSPPPASSPSSKWGGANTSPAPKVKDVPMSQDYATRQDRPAENATPAKSPKIPPPGTDPPSSVPSYDAAAQKAVQREQSREKYAKSNQPRQTHSASQEKAVKNLKPEMTYDKWNTRQSRHDQVYSRYYNQPPVYVFRSPYYSDPFNNPWFWMWYWNQTNIERDMWVYNHRSELDSARYEELKARDREQERRLAELERQGVRQDSTYTPSDLKGNRDLMYGDDVAKPAYAEANASHIPWFWVFLVLFGLLVAAVFFFPIIKRRK